MMATPWGPSQSVTELAHGITLVTTAGHGGIKLSPERQAQMPASCRQTPYSEGGWYEEDCDALLPLYRFYADCEPNLTISRELIVGALMSNVRYYTNERLRDLGVIPVYTTLPMI
jgi:hypothetical protein